MCEILGYQSSGRLATGRFVAHDGSRVIVFSRTPHGGHHLVAVALGRNVAICHDNPEALREAYSNMAPRCYRRVRRFLRDRQIAVDLEPTGA